MKIGVLKEVKDREGRVALTPSHARQLARHGHRVFVQKHAGIVSGFADEDYTGAGAMILADTPSLIRKSDLVLKVKEPTLMELKFARPGQIFFCFLHLAAMPEVLREILKQKIVAVGYETVESDDGKLPLLAPMSEIAGQLASLNGAQFLRADYGGRGVLIGGTAKVLPAHVLVLGAGVVGENAARIAWGMGGVIHVVDVSVTKLQRIKRIFRERCFTYPSRPSIIARLVRRADLIVGAALIPAKKAPKLVTRAMVKAMKKGSVIVDVSVDQGGCVETSEVTSHSSPTVVKYGVIHYGVPNMPAVVPVTGTLALTRESFPYVMHLADMGLERCMAKYSAMRRAVNCSHGRIVHPALT